MLAAAACAAAANVLVLLKLGAYDARLGPLHLVSHSLFKPLLLLNGSFLLAILIRKPRAERAGRLGVKVPLVLGALALPVLSFSVSVNPLIDEWNYRGFNAAIPARSLVHLFVSAQLDAWYRPLGFVSLWLDHAMFGEHVWAYHLQNLGLHAANSVLLAFLARRLCVSHTISTWTGTLYLTAAVAYEPVMWPAARFDLLAMFFVSVAFITALRYIEDGGGAALWLALSSYGLALCSKESAYAFPVLLVIAIASTRKAKKSRWILLTGSVVAVAGGMLFVRRAVLGGIGGYAVGAGALQYIGLSLSGATLRAVLERTIPMSLVSVNLSYPMPVVVKVLLAVFAVLLAAAVLSGASLAPRYRLFAVYALAATLPAAPLLGLLDARAQSVRYIYMPAAFALVLTGLALANARKATLLLSVFAISNLCFGFYNVWIYRATYRQAERLGSVIVEDVAKEPGSPGVTVLGMQDELNGTLFSRSEVELRVKQHIPQVSIEFDRERCTFGRLCYEWLPSSGELRRIVR